MLTQEVDNSVVLAGHGLHTAKCRNTAASIGDGREIGEGGTSKPNYLHEAHVLSALCLFRLPCFDAPCEPI
jgi:hypothetical protein